MKGLPEHIKDVDGFYKAKSEDDFMPELPENLWEEIELHLPSAPLSTPVPPSAEKGGGALKGINFYHGGLFYAAGLLSAFLVYTAYIHFTHQEDTASIQVALPSLGQNSQPLDSISATHSVTEEGQTNEKPFSNNQRVQEEIKSSKSGLSKTEEKTANSKGGTKEEVVNPSTSELPTEVSHPQTTQGSEQNEKSELTESKTSAPTAVPEEHTDFYHKHSKKAKDSLSKQLFIPKK